MAVGPAAAVAVAAEMVAVAVRAVAAGLAAMAAMEGRKAAKVGNQEDLAERMGRVAASAGYTHGAVASTSCTRTHQSMRPNQCIRRSIR